jgi:hypothetical protein
MARTELIFGTERGSRGPVSKTEWRRFVDREIATRFPDGFTVLDGHGGWRDGIRAVRETSRILIVWRRTGSAGDGAFEDLRSIYKKRFGQTSVMRIDGFDCVTF